MLTTDERMSELNWRVKQLRRRWEARSVAALSAACVAICIGFWRMAVLLGSKPHYVNVPEMYGSALLFESAGGYVLVGVGAFILAVIITFACLRYKGKIKK